MKKVTNKAGKSFWAKIKKPFFVIAPMANVTDYAFRTMFAKYGKPDVMWNEFVSADGLCSPGREKLLHDLKFSSKERPIVAQLFTGHADKMKQATTLCRDLGFDGVDINMGCPDRAVEKQGGGSAMIKNPTNAIEVLNSARKGWLASKKAKKFEDLYNTPISVKTRIGYNKDEIDTWIRLLLEQKLPVLTVHLRTRKEMSDVPAHWELMPKIMKLRDEVSPETLIIGNGDVNTLDDAKDKIKQYGCDGVMVGRGVFGSPWFFSEKASKKYIDRKNKKVVKEILEIMLEHTKLFEKTYCAKKRLKNFAVMKKHFKAYVHGWDGAKELRVKMMEANNYKEVKKVVDEYMKSL